MQKWQDVLLPTREALELSGLSASQLDYLLRANIYRPSRQLGRPGKGSRWVHSFRDVVSLTAVGKYLRHYVRDIGLLTGVIRFLQTHPEADPDRIPREKVVQFVAPSGDHAEAEQEGEERYGDPTVPVEKGIALWEYDQMFDSELDLPQLPAPGTHRLPLGKIIDDLKDQLDLAGTREREEGNGQADRRSAAQG